MNTKIIQIAAFDSSFYALDDSGNLWEMWWDRGNSNKRWRLVIPHSQDKEIPPHFKETNIY